MVSPRDVVAFHADYDVHTDDRVRLFQAIAEVVPPAMPVFYPGSYVDIAPSVWFEDVTYLDVDARAARFFGEADAVDDLIAAKRAAAGAPAAPPARVAFVHGDYADALPVAASSVGLLVSLYAGFVSEHCGNVLQPGGVLLVNSSHGDAAMASIDPRFELVGVVVNTAGRYSVSTDALETHLVPKKPQEITVDSLHASGRGVAYRRSPFAYLFARR